MIELMAEFQRGRTKMNRQEMLTFVVLVFLFVMALSTPAGVKAQSESIT